VCSLAPVWQKLLELVDHQQKIRIELASPGVPGWSPTTLRSSVLFVSANNGYKMGIALRLRVFSSNRTGHLVVSRRLAR
jgi:hypothetical protein